MIYLFIAILLIWGVIKSTHKLACWLEKEDKLTNKARRNSA